MLKRMSFFTPEKEMQTTEQYKKTKHFNRSSSMYKKNSIIKIGNSHTKQNKTQQKGNDGPGVTHLSLQDCDSKI